MKKIAKKMVILASALIIAAPLLAIPAAAQTPDPYGTDVVGQNLPMSDRDPREIAVRVINIALGFLGIIAVFIILLGGFKWMTAAGSEEQVAEAKKIIMSGIIGLIIIFAAWGIAKFVISQLQNISTNP